MCFSFSRPSNPFWENLRIIQIYHSQSQRVTFPVIKCNPSRKRLFFLRYAKAPSIKDFRNLCLLFDPILWNFDPYLLWFFTLLWSNLSKNYFNSLYDLFSYLSIPFNKFPYLIQKKEPSLNYFKFKYRPHILYVLIKWLKLKVNTYHEMELLLLFHSWFFFLPYSLDAISEKVCQYVL